MEEFLDGLGRRAKVFAPIGRCIYCGETESPLGEEHIIPFALGGNLILPKASCSNCADITGRQVEGAVLDSNFGALGIARLRLKLPTRRPKKRPAARVLSITGVDGHVRTTTIPVGSLPLAFIGFTCDPPEPGILRGAEPSPRFTGTEWVKINAEELAKHAKPQEKISGLGKFNPFTYARMIAKIAHSLAVADYGFASFQPFLPDIILGKSTEVFHYVGASADPEPDTKGLHNLHIGWRESKPEYLIAYVRLFCNYGTPDYKVVVGERLPQV